MARPQIRRTSYSHEAFANWLLENPHRPLRDAAEYFEYTQSWLSTILHSDAFQELLRSKQALVEQMIIADIPAKLRATTDVALEKLSAKIEKSEDPDYLLDATDKLLHRMGYAPSSARNPGAVNLSQTNIQNNISVSAPDLAAARHALLAKSQPQSLGTSDSPIDIPAELVKALPEK